MAAIVGMTIRHGLKIEFSHRNQPNGSKLVLYKQLLQFYSKLKQLYISTKTEHFIYKGGCGICGSTHFETFNRGAGLGYRQIASAY